MAEEQREMIVAVPAPAISAIPAPGSQLAISDRIPCKLPDGLDLLARVEEVTTHVGQQMAKVRKGMEAKWSKAKWRNTAGPELSRLSFDAIWELLMAVLARASSAIGGVDDPALLILRFVHEYGGVDVRRDLTTKELIDRVFKYADAKLRLEELVLFVKRANSVPCLGELPRWPAGAPEGAPEGAPVTAAALQRALQLDPPDDGFIEGVVDDVQGFFSDVMLQPHKISWGTFLTPLMEAMYHEFRKVRENAAGVDDCRDGDDEGEGREDDDEDDDDDDDEEQGGDDDCDDDGCILAEKRPRRRRRAVEKGDVVKGVVYPIAGKRRKT